LLEPSFFFLLCGKKDRTVGFNGTAERLGNHGWFFLAVGGKMVFGGCFPVGKERPSSPSALLVGELRPFAVSLLNTEQSASTKSQFHIRSLTEGSWGQVCVWGGVREDCASKFRVAGRMINLIVVCVNFHLAYSSPGFNRCSE
jgi:hypothetical protein